MEDSQIVELLYRHEEAGLWETQKQYSALLRSVCTAILGGDDADECVNDTYLKLWDVIPPYRPSHFRAFLCKLARQISIDRYRRNRAAKADTSRTVSFDELCEDFPDDALGEVSVSDLREEIDRFAGGLDVTSRVLFLRRYFFAESQAELAGRFGMTENAVDAKLFRLRRKLKKQLTERGYFDGKNS